MPFKLNNFPGRTKKPCVQGIIPALDKKLSVRQPDICNTATSYPDINNKAPINKDLLYP